MLHILLHTHAYGCSVYPFQDDPQVRLSAVELAEILGVDFEGEEGEDLEIVSYKDEEIIDLRSKIPSPS